MTRNVHPQSSRTPCSVVAHLATEPFLRWSMFVVLLASTVARLVDQKIGFRAKRRVTHATDAALECHSLPVDVLQLLHVSVSRHVFVGDRVRALAAGVKVKRRVRK